MPVVRGVIRWCWLLDGWLLDLDFRRLDLLNVIVVVGICGSHPLPHVECEVSRAVILAFDRTSSTLTISNDEAAALLEITKVEIESAEAEWIGHFDGDWMFACLVLVLEGGFSVLWLCCSCLSFLVDELRG